MLVRELEFFFTVWQTLFEASAFLLHETGRADGSRSRSRRPLEDFLTLVLGYRSNTQSDWRRLVSVCLQLHDNLVSPRVAKWQEKAINLVGAEKNINAFIKLHNNKDIETFGTIGSSELPEALAHSTLHTVNYRISAMPSARGASKTGSQEQAILLFRPNSIVTDGVCWVPVPSFPDSLG